MEDLIKLQNEVVILIVHLACLLDSDLSAVRLNSVAVCRN